MVVNNDGGGIFETLEQAAFDGVFERLFGTSHGASIERLAAAFGVPYTLVEQPGELAKAVSGTGLRIVAARTDRAANAEPGVFERMFGTPHGASLEHLAAAFGVPYTLVTRPSELGKAVSGSGLRVVEARTDRAANAELRDRMRAAATRAAAPASDR